MPAFDSWKRSRFGLRTRGLLLAALAGMVACGAQAEAAKAPPIHTLFVEALDRSGTSAAVDQQLVRRIERSGDLRLVADKRAADAVLLVKAVVWPQGTYISNAHARTNSVSQFEGYASAELVSPAEDPLWSYLATPGRLRFGTITSDLADQIYVNLRAALAHGVSQPSAAAESAGAAAGSLRIAGATFPAPLYRKWLESYAAQTGSPVIPYQAAGSVEGLRLLAAGEIDLAASDLPDTSGSSLDERDVLRFPTVVGGVVPIVNLPGVSRPLRFTGRLLAEIYSGKVRRWNDAEVRRWNREIALPDAEIVVVHRSDGSGTSFVWTSFLAAASADWAGKAAASPSWPVGLGAVGNDGVASAVQSTPLSIGYVELTYAIQHDLSYGSVQNPAGQFIRADLQTIADAAQSAGSAAAAHSLLNEPGVNAYPISTFTYLLLPRTQALPGKLPAETALLRWMLTSGQRQCASLGYVPLPRALAESELQQISAAR